MLKYNISYVGNFRSAEADAVFSGQREQRVDKRRLISVRSYARVAAIVDLIKCEVGGLLTYETDT